MIVLASGASASPTPLIKIWVPPPKEAQETPFGTSD